MLLEKENTKQKPLPQSGGAYLRFSKFILLTVVLLICFVPRTALCAEETTKETTVNAKESDCKDLKPFNNIDELLYQFYVNADSNCLFNKSIFELEEIWDVKILDEKRAKPQNYYPLSETEFYNKPYKSEKDAFYIEFSYDVKNIYMRAFKLKITKDYFEKHGTLFPYNTIPKFLPTPSRFYSAGGLEDCIFPQFIKTIPSTGDTSCAYHVWENADKTQVITLNSFDKVEIAKTDYDTYKKNSSDNEKEPDKTQSGALVTAVENEANAPCRGLKPYNNLEELLYQFYINLDSDCLFKMSTAEFEKIWDIKILSDERFEHGQLLYQSIDSSDFNNKPYKTEKDAFYVEIKQDSANDINKFTINITEDYYKKHATLFPNGNFPKSLPKPLKEWRVPSYGKITFLGMDSSANPKPKKPGEYAFINSNIIHWVSFEKKNEICLYGINGSVTSISINKLGDNYVNRRKFK